MASRETIYSALFSRLADATGVATSSRRIRSWADVPSQEMPALFQVQKSEVIEQPGRGLPGKVFLKADIYVYVYTPNDQDTPATQLNAMIDAIEASIAPDYTGCQTLDGLVSHCWISGNIETDEGVLGQIAVAIIPVDILINH